MPSALVRHLERSASQYTHTNSNSINAPQAHAQVAAAAAPPRRSRTIPRSNSNSSTESSGSRASRGSDDQSESSSKQHRRPLRSILKKNRRSSSFNHTSFDDEKRFLFDAEEEEDFDSTMALKRSGSSRRRGGGGGWLNRLLSPSLTSLSTSSPSSTSTSNRSSRSKRGRSLRYIGRHVFSRRTLTAVLCLAALAWNWQMYTLGQAWELDWKASSSGSGDGGIGKKVAESGNGYTIWALPFAFRIYSLVGIACAGIGLAGLIKVNHPSLP